MIMTDRLCWASAQPVS